ncbi:MAG: NAD(P)/FAD-dependent oxidoreductase [bacterium]|nr:NAD(P)/FAD-dependent oxidoreductase [bacterium]MDY2649558.1 NAD(P)/FAD-dependent oxidoreductase [Candidatus Egerieousia sp.]
MISVNVAIVGGGAAGLFAALYGSKVILKSNRVSAPPSSGSAEILIFEKMPRPGRKIGLTGKGRCNLTNTKPWEEFSRHIHPKADFFRSAFYNCSNAKVMELFQECGLPLVEERGNRVFPRSMRAIDVIDTLVAACKEGGIPICTNTAIKEIQPLPDAAGGGAASRSLPDAAAGCRFLLIGEDGRPVAAARSVIIATGGLSYPSTGSTGDGYTFAKRLGHTVTPLFPSLTALIPENYDQMWQCIGETLHLKNVQLSLKYEGNILASEFGDADFTNGGIEGPIGYKLSRRAVELLSINPASQVLPAQQTFSAQQATQAKQASGVRVKSSQLQLILDLKPAVSREELASRLSSIIRSKGRAAANLQALLREVMPGMLIRPFLFAHPALPMDPVKIAKELKSWQFTITGYVGYNRAVVTAGGVSLSELSKKNLESKLHKGLFFAGEVIDMDCDTGGYNLQMAFSTGALAMRGALEK